MTTSDSECACYSDVVVICGPPRSGTTWLHRELCTAPETFPFLPECTFLTQQVELYHRTLHYGDRKRIEAHFGTDAMLQDYFRLNVHRLINRVACLNSKNGASMLILKDPNLCLYLRDLNDLLPPHKVIVLLRDPRDVLASMKNVAKSKNESWNANAAAAQVINYYYQIGNYQPYAGENVRFVRYEEIVSGLTEELVSFLQLSSIGSGFSEAGTATVRERLDSTDPFFSDLYLQPTTSERVGSFNRILSRKEIRDFESSHAAVIRRWGYSPSSSKARMAFVLTRIARSRLSQ